MIIDTKGKKQEYASSAMRDAATGKGRCDLLPLNVVALLTGDDLFLKNIDFYIRQQDLYYLKQALNLAIDKLYAGCTYTAILEVAVHFEEGCQKYGERNWEKGEVIEGEWTGIPPARYLDSAIRHYLKWRRGDDDESHDRAVIWNIMCCLWTIWRINELEAAEVNK